MAKVLIIDTSILCVWLELPGFERCGSDADPWDMERVKAKIEMEETAGNSLILPLATIIETGNHISHIKTRDILPYAQRFADILRASVNNEAPWAAFSDQGQLWDNEAIIRYADTWPLQAARRQSLGDASIVDVANYFVQLGEEVEIFTGDEGLRSYSPATPTLPGLRRNRK